MLTFKLPPLSARSWAYDQWGRRRTSTEQFNSVHASLSQKSHTEKKWNTDKTRWQWRYIVEWSLKSVSEIEDENPPMHTEVTRIIIKAKYMLAHGFFRFTQYNHRNTQHVCLIHKTTFLWKCNVVTCSICLSVCPWTGWYLCYDECWSNYFGSATFDL